jgi:hypothetical protein
MTKSETDFVYHIMEGWKFIPEWLPRENEEPKEFLYHYTTPEGLLGIFESESIRATHVRYLNDRTELKNALSPEFEDQIMNNIFPSLDEERKKSLRKSRQNKKPPEVFVASFTDDASAQVEGETRPGDRLSQWRAYSNPTGGYSLGFDSKLIMGGWKLSGLKGTLANLLLRCKYNTEEKRKAAERIGNWGFEIHRQIPESRIIHFRKESGREPNLTEREFIEMLSETFVLATVDAKYFIEEAARFKDMAFSEECEWRIVVHVNRQNLLDAHCSDQSSPILHFRQGKYGVTPYIELPLRLTSPESPLRKIIVGPSPNEEETVGGVKLLLESKGIKIKTDESPNGVEVVPSKIPYRNW